MRERVRQDFITPCLLVAGWGRRARCRQQETCLACLGNYISTFHSTGQFPLPGDVGSCIFHPGLQLPAPLPPNRRPAAGPWPGPSRPGRAVVPAVGELVEVIFSTPLPHTGVSATSPGLASPPEGSGVKRPGRQRCWKLGSVQPTLTLCLAPCWKLGSQK